jgi:hypothetical protein
MENHPHCLIKKLSWAAYAIGALGVGYFLWVHKAHVLQYVPYLMLLLCPLMHLRGGHGGHGHETCKKAPEKNTGPETK